MINITQNLLDDKNSLIIGNKTVGDALLEKGISNLWEDRTENIDTIVIHYMSAINISPHSPYELSKIMEIFLTYEVSAHYLIDREGHILQLVPTVKKAWHAGKSIMPNPDNRESVNNFSIGIELIGIENIPFTNYQYKSLNSLLAKLKDEYPINKVLGHDDISGQRSVDLGLRDDIKIDPGPLFNWDIID